MQKNDLILLDPHFVQDAEPCTATNDDALSLGHLTYHCEQMRKLNIAKIDTTLAFGFYLRDYEDFKYFRAFLQGNQHIYKENWLFSHFEQKPERQHIPDHLLEEMNFSGEDDEEAPKKTSKQMKKDLKKKKIRAGQD